MKLFAEHLDQIVDGLRWELQLFLQRFLRAKDKESLTVRRHRALEEQAVDTHWVLKRVTQPARRREVQQQAAHAIVQIEIEQRDATRVPVGEVPRKVDRHCAGADASTGTHDGDQLAELAADR